MDNSDEQEYPSVCEPDNEYTDVFWYDNGKKAIPLTEPNAEIPQEGASARGVGINDDAEQFAVIKGEQCSIFDEPTEPDDIPDQTYDDEPLDEAEPKKEKKLTLRDIFNELYKYAVHLPKKERNEFYRDNLLPYFADEDSMNGFIQSNLERKKRNLILRRVRMVRKANLADFNYFCTFTYSDKLHDEASFKKRLKYTFANLCKRKQWKYMGVWERSPEKQRLHFHGLFQIPEGQMVGELFEKRDYNFSLHNMRTTYQNTYFNERFGRSDFEYINNKGRVGEALAYLMKYIEKTGEKIVYSKGLPQYFVTDVAESDVATRIGLDDRKLLLFDNFACYNNQQYVGTVSKDTITKLPTGN